MSDNRSRNFLLLCCHYYFFCIPAMAEYKPIPETLSKQYKAEMERIIDEDYPIVIKKLTMKLKKQAL